ncbi:hypothetical protein [Aliarcobacter cryaerophilus]|uniref:hypothetical protein n=1 Tax=Aliarcobacter cryaerophilus TaxID=28198 RepID=UPI003BAE273D
MNEAIHILKNFKVEKKVKLKKLDVSNMRDMQTIIKDTKNYLSNLKKGIENG